MRKQNLPYGWKDTNHYWTSSPNIDIEQQYLLALSIMREQLINKHPQLQTQPWVWDAVNKKIKKETGKSMNFITTCYTGCSYGGLNTAVDLIDHYRKLPGYNPHNFRNGNKAQKNVVKLYKKQLKTKASRKKLLETVLLPNIKKALKNVPGQLILDNLDKERARHVQDQKGTGRRSSSVVLTSYGNQKKTYKKMVKCIAKGRPIP